MKKHLCLFLLFTILFSFKSFSKETTTKPTKTLQGKVSKIIPKKTKTIKIYNQLFSDNELIEKSINYANFSSVIKDTFNVNIELVNSITKENLPDILILNTKDEQYKNLISDNLLLNWQKDDLLNQWAPYLASNLKAPLQKNRFLSQEKRYLHGIPTNISLFPTNPSYTNYQWNLNFNYFKEIQSLTNLQLNTLEDYFLLLKFIKFPTTIDLINNDNTESNSTDEKEIDNSIIIEELQLKENERKNEYALALYKDSETNPECDLNIFASELVSAYFGCQVFYLGFYNIQTGKFENALNKNSNYIKALSFLNDLFINNLINPKSEKFTKKDFIKEYESGYYFWNYSNIFPTNEKLINNNFPVYPAEAKLIAKGQSTYGSENIWAISSNTQNAQLCLAIINWISTPEGYLSVLYGKKNKNWQIKNKKIIVSHNQTIADNLEFPISVNSTTPFDLNSTYNVNKKHSVQSKTFSEWQVWSNSQTTEEFLFKSNYILEPDCLYKIKPIEEELIESYNTIRKIILSQSHKSIFSKNKEDFNKCIDEMISSCEKNNNWGKLKDFFNVQANERANFESFAIGKSK